MALFVPYPFSGETANRLSEKYIGEDPTTTLREAQGRHWIARNWMDYTGNHFYYIIPCNLSNPLNPGSFRQRKELGFFEGVDQYCAGAY